MKLMMLVGKNEDVKIKKVHLDKHDEEVEREEMFEEIEEILENHPKTWKKYEDTEDECDSIINMEIQELMDAKKHKHFHELEKEYLHCAAAFLYGHEMAKEKYRKSRKHEEK